jgi:hypothetical protein
LFLWIQNLFIPLLEVFGQTTWYAAVVWLVIKFISDGICRCIRGDRPMLLQPVLAQQLLWNTLRRRNNNQHIPFCIKQFRHRELFRFDNPSDRPRDHIWFHGSLRERSEIVQHRCLLMKRHKMDSSERHDECCMDGFMMRNQVYITLSRASQGWGTKTSELSIRASVNCWNQRRLLDPICNAKARSLILSTDVFAMESRHAYLFTVYYATLRFLTTYHAEYPLWLAELLKQANASNSFLLSHNAYA